VLERGRIAEIGRHAELLAKRGIYARLYELQFAEATKSGTDHVFQVAGPLHHVKHCFTIAPWSRPSPKSAIRRGHLRRCPPGPHRTSRRRPGRGERRGGGSIILTPIRKAARPEEVTATVRRTVKDYRKTLRKLA